MNANGDGGTLPHFDTRLVTADAQAGDPDLLDRCLAGEIVLVRGFLQQIRALDLVRDVLLSAIRTINEEAASSVAREGFDRAHEVLSLDEFLRLVGVAENRLLRIERKLFGKVLRRGLGWKPVWVCRQPIIRFHLPYPRTAPRRGDLEKFREDYGNARLTTLRPHRDCWFDEPSTSINVWIALGTVVPGNGMSLFDTDYDRSLVWQRRVGVTRDQRMTRPRNVKMAAGDALFFHANQLHASEVNRTDITRCVMSLRLAVDDPKLSMGKSWRYVRVDPRWPLAFWWLLQSRRRGAGRLRKLLPGLLTAPGATDAGARWS